MKGRLGGLTLRQSLNGLRRNLLWKQMRLSQKMSSHAWQMWKISVTTHQGNAKDELTRGAWIGPKRRSDVQPNVGCRTPWSTTRTGGNRAYEPLRVSLATSKHVAHTNARGYLVLLKGRFGYARSYVYVPIDSYFCSWHFFFAEFRNNSTALNALVNAPSV